MQSVKFPESSSNLAAIVIALMQQTAHKFRKCVTDNHDKDLHIMLCQQGIVHLRNINPRRAGGGV